MGHARGARAKGLLCSKSPMCTSHSVGLEARGPLPDLGLPDGSDFSSSSEEARRMKQGKEAGQDAQWKLTGGRETEAGNEVLAARPQL